MDKVDLSVFSSIITAHTIGSATDYTTSGRLSIMAFLFSFWE